MLFGEIGADVVVIGNELSSRVTLQDFRTKTKFIPHQVYESAHPTVNYFLSIVKKALFCVHLQHTEYYYVHTQFGMLNSNEK